MDPLAAYRTSVVPGLRPVAAPMSPESAAKIIPRDELEKLSSSVLNPQTGVTPNLSPTGATGGSFQSLLGNMVSEVNAKQVEANAAMKSVISGGDVPLHKAMIASEEASVSFQLMVEVRNRLLESYQELMRMQV